MCLVIALRKIRGNSVRLADQRAHKSAYSELLFFCKCHENENQTSQFPGAA